MSTKYFGSENGLVILSSAGECRITKNYNTGLMVGDIELALCDGITDRSGSATVVTDNGAAVIAAVAVGAEQKKITATGGTITATVTTGGKIYGWEYINGSPVYRAGTGWVGVSESGGVLTIADGTTFSMLRYTNGSGPTAAQYIQQESDELPLFQINAACLLTGLVDAVLGVSVDPNNGLLHATQSDKRNVFDGLERIYNTDDTFLKSLDVSGGIVLGN